MKITKVRDAGHFDRIKGTPKTRLDLITRNRRSDIALLPVSFKGENAIDQPVGQLDSNYDYGSQ
ncbi:MAG: hypothetical protein ACLQU2_21155 [Candidatus Binataceae bacterium]